MATYTAGTVYLRVAPTLSGFHADLRREVRALVPEPKIDVKINPVWDGSGIPPIPDQRVKIKADVDKNSLSSAIGAFTTLGGVMAKLALGSGVAGAIPILGALTAAAVASAGALLVLPALGAQLALAFAAAKVGMAGFGDALKNMGDPAKFAEAIAQLTPAARGAAIAIRDLKPAWEAVQNTVQENLFRGVANSIRDLGGAYIPVLEGGLGAMASSLNRTFVELSRFLTLPRVVTDIADTFGNANRAAREMESIGSNVVSIFVDIARVGSDFLPGLATGWARGAENAANYVGELRESGRLHEIIQNGLTAISQLGELFGNIGGIITTVWTAANQAGGGYLNVMIQATGAARDFLNSAQGFGALTAIFTAIRETITALMPGLLAVLDNVARTVTILTPVLPVIGQAVSGLLAALAPLLPIAGEIVAVLGTFLAEAVMAVTPLISTLASVVGGILMAALNALRPVFPALVEAIRLLEPPLSQVVQLVGDILVEAINAVAPLIPDLANLFVILVRDAVVPLIGPLTDIIRNILPVLVVVLRSSAESVSFLAGILDDILVPIIRDVVVPILDLLVIASGYVGDAALFLESTMRQAWANVAEAVRVAWEDYIRPAWDATVEFVRAVFEPVIQFLWTAIRIAFGAIGAIILLTWEGVIRPAWQALVDFVNGVIIPAVQFLYNNVFRPIWDAIGAVVRTVWETVLRPIWDALVGFIETRINPANEEAQRVIGIAWETIGTGIRYVRDTFIQPVFDGLQSGLQVVQDSFGTAVTVIGQLWGGLRAAVRAPVQAVIDVVYNNGIVRAWNIIADFVGLGDQKLDPFILPGYAKGGPVVGHQIAQLGEEGPEYVLSAPAVRNLGGLQAVDTLHRDAIGKPRDIVRELNRGHIVEGADHEGPGYSTVGFGGVRPWVAKAGHYLKRRFGIGVVGGVGQRANASDHPRGLALDFMTSGENGTDLAQEVIRNKGHYGVTYAIWRQQINNGSGWRRMEDRGSPTANHMDHVHVSFTGGPPGAGGGNTGGLEGGGGGWSFDPIGYVMGVMGNIGDMLGQVAGGGTIGNYARAFGSKVFTTVKDFAIRKVTDWIGTVGSWFTGGGGSGGAEQWRPQVLTALQQVGQPADLADTTLRRMNQESSGNPQAVNRNDVNWQRGTPSVGLMQVIGPTFRQHAGRYANTGPFLYGVSTDPVANIYASMRYALSRYGSLANAYNRSGGYDTGGLAIGQGWMWKGPQKERVLSPRQTRAFEELVAFQTGRSFGTRLVPDRGEGLAFADGAGGGGPFIGQLVVPTPEGAGVNETIDAVMTRAEHAARSGRYGRP